MSAFRDLLKQAHEKGVEFVGFTCHVDEFFTSEQSKSWKCYASGPGLKPDTRNEARGRTGEEALRHLVERL